LAKHKVCRPYSKPIQLTVKNVNNIKSTRPKSIFFRFETDFVIRPKSQPDVRPRRPTSLANMVNIIDFGMAKAYAQIAVV